MKKTFGTAAAFAMICSSLGCLSQEEIENRRKWAFDLSGGYGEVRPDGTTAGTVAIENQGDKNDVKVIFLRGALYDGEAPFLARVADEAKRTELTTTLTLGAASDELIEDVVGGENYSKDYGKTSEVHVASDDVEATPSVEGAEDAKVRWALDATIANGTADLKGTLRVTFEERRPKATDPDELELAVEDESFEVSFARTDGAIDADKCEECLGEDEEEVPVADEAP